jgi:hypothetical protein
MGHGFDGSIPSPPREDGTIHDRALAKRRAYALTDVDFGVVGAVVAHAQERAPTGEVAHVELERRVPYEAELLWKVSLKVAGDQHIYFYDIDGDPLVDEPLDFLALPKDVFKRIEKAIDPQAKVVSLSLTVNQALLEVTAPKSQRDTDRVLVRSNGVVSSPIRWSRDRDADELAKRILALRDVDWGALRRAIADAAKTLDAEITRATVTRREGGLQFSIDGVTERRAWRSATYDASGRRMSEL